MHGSCLSDIDECVSHPCQHGGSCSTPQVAMFSCLCVPGYSGTSCETGVSETVTSGSCTVEHNFTHNVNIELYSGMVGNLKPEDDKRTRTNRYFRNWLHGSHIA